MGTDRSPILLQQHANYIKEKILLNSNSKDADLIDILYKQHTEPIVIWTELEHNTYCEALRAYGKDYKKI